MEDARRGVSVAVRDLSFEYVTDSQSLRVLEHVSFTIEAGDAHFLIGWTTQIGPFLRFPVTNNFANIVSLGPCGRLWRKRRRIVEERVERSRVS